MEFPFLQSSGLKHKYFYRTGTWSWISQDQIQVVDSKSSRLVTMDPWPQQVYLDASGQKTVEEYIHDFAEMYPSSQVPPELDQTIINVLTGMINDGGLIQLTDRPKKLDFESHRPIEDSKSKDIRGRWEGYYTYDLPNENGIDQLGEVEFVININDVLGEKFYGTVEDNIVMGGTPGIGRVEGVLEGKNFRFEKMMPVHTSRNQKGEKCIDESRKHPVITYKGSFLDESMSVKGTWRFKKKVVIKKWFIPIRVSAGNGRFEMRRVSETW